MKSVTLLVLLFSTLIISHAQEEPILPVEVLASATAKTGQGLKEIKKVALPKGITFFSEPEVVLKETEIQIVKFTFDSKKYGATALINKLDERISLEKIQSKLNEAGFRPATFEEVAAVRQELATILKNECVMVCGTKATMNNKDYYLCCSFDYVLGTDILTSPPGRFGLVTTSWETSMVNIVFAVVKNQ